MCVVRSQSIKDVCLYEYKLVEQAVHYKEEKNLS